MTKRGQLRLRKRLARENPVGKVYTATAGYAGSLPGQQELICLPLSMYQAEIRGLYSNYGPYGSTIASRTAMHHDEQSNPQLTINQDITLAGINTVLKEYIYVYDTSRKYVFKNHGNQNMEIVCYKVVCTESITADMYDCLSTSNTQSAIELLVKNNAANEADVLNNVIEPYGTNTSTSTGGVVASTAIAVNANNNISGGDDTGVQRAEGGGSTFGGVNTKFKNWARIGFSPKEVKSFQKHFKIIKKARKVLASNEVMEYKWFSDNIRKIDCRTLELGSDTHREVHTVAGTSWLMFVIRGFPAIMQFATGANVASISAPMWAYDETQSGVTQTASNLASASDVVTTAPSSLIWTCHTSTKFGSLANVFSKIYNIESVLPSSKVATNPVVEIDEDGETAHAYRNAFRLA